MTSAADIRAARARTKQTQSEFGERFGVSRWTIALWEEEGPPSAGPARLLLDRILNELKGQPNAATDAVDAGTR